MIELLKILMIPMQFYFNNQAYAQKIKYLENNTLDYFTLRNIIDDVSFVKFIIPPFNGALYYKGNFEVRNDKGWIDKGSFSIDNTNAHKTMFFKDKRFEVQKETGIVLPYLKIDNPIQKLCSPLQNAEIFDIEKTFSGIKL